MAFVRSLPQSVTIISGGARGVDVIAAETARERGMKLIEIRPDYKGKGGRAPLDRNDQIVDLCDFVVAFWNGKSSGTAYTINRAKKLGKPVRVYDDRDET